MKTEDKLLELFGGTPDKLKDAAKALEQLRTAEKQALAKLKRAQAKVQQPPLEHAFKDMHKLQDAAMVRFMELFQDEIRNLRDQCETATLFVLRASPLLASVRALADAKRDFLGNGIVKLQEIGKSYTVFYNCAKEIWLQCNALKCVADHSYYHNARTNDLTKFLSGVFDTIDDLSVMCDFPAVNHPKQDVLKFFNGLQQLCGWNAEFHPGYEEYHEKGFIAWFDICLKWYRNDAELIKESLRQIDVVNNQSLQDAKSNVISNVDQQLAPALASLQAFRNAMNNLLTLAGAYNPATE